MPKLQTQFITCPKCSGLAKETADKVCPECGGIGLGTFIKNDFLYWGYDLTPAKIILRQSRIIFSWAVDVLSLLLGLGGLISLGFWIKNNAMSGWQVHIGTFLSFWGIKDGFILFFWIGILFLLFFYFKRIKNKKNYPPVKTLKYRAWQKISRQKQVVPNNWKELRLFRTKIDVSKSYNKTLIKLLERAYALAIQFKHKEFLPAHILLAVFAESENKKESVEAKRIKTLFAKLDIFKGKIAPKIENELKNITAEQEDEKEIIPIISPALRKCLIEGYLKAMDNGRKKVDILDLAGSLVHAGEITKKIMADLDVEIENIENVAEWLIMNDQYSRKKYEIAANKSIMAKMKNKMKRATSAISTPVLNHFCKNLTQKIQLSKNDLFFGREDGLNSIFKAYENKNKAIFLTGHQGVGKKAIIYELAKKITENDVPAILSKKRILQLDLKKLYKEVPEVDIEKKLLVIMLELTKASNTILAIENLDEKMWQIIKDYAGSFFLLASTDKNIESNKIVNININEPKKEDLIMITASQAVILEEKYNIDFKYQALETAVVASACLKSDKAQPAKTIELLNEIALEVSRQRQRIIDDVAVAKFSANKTGVPYTKILKEN